MVIRDTAIIFDVFLFIHLYRRLVSFPLFSYRFIPIDHRPIHVSTLQQGCLYLFPANMLIYGYAVSGLEQVTKTSAATASTALSFQVNV